MRQSSDDKIQLELGIDEVQLLDAEALGGIAMGRIERQGTFAALGEWLLSLQRPKPTRRELEQLKEFERRGLS